MDDKDLDRDAVTPADEATEAARPDPGQEPTDPTEGADRDPPAWQGPAPDEASTGLVDPRHEIPNPAGL